MADFFFKTSKISYYLLMLPKNYRYPLTFVTAVTITFFWFFLVYKPLSNSYQCGIAQFNQLHNAQKLSMKTKQINTNLEKEIHKKQNSLKNALKKYTLCLPKSTTILALLFDQAHSHQLSVQTHSPQEIIDSDWYTIHEYSTTFQGAFNNVLQFLEKIAAKKINVRKVYMSKIDTDTVQCVCHYDLYEIKESCP